MQRLLTSAAFCWSAVLVPALGFDAYLERESRRHPERKIRSLSRMAGEHPVVATGGFVVLGLHCQWARIRRLCRR